ncbi:MAG: transposase-like protein [Paracoccaceae bacterium]|jgi:transposase-like protein
MFIRKGKGPVFVSLKDGSKMSRADLPPAATRRWVASRKARVVLAVEAGLLDQSEACKTYGLSQEELSDWCNKARAHGEVALKTTATQKYIQP